MNKYKYNLNYNVQEMIKFIMDNPHLIISKLNKNDYDGYSKIKIDKEGNLIELIYSEENGCNLYEDPYNINIYKENKFFIDGFIENNFFWVCSKIANKIILNFNSLYSYLRNHKNDKLILFLKDVYWIYLSEVLDKAVEENSNEINFIDDIAFE